MILPKAQDARHKNQMYRLLKAILSDNLLANQLYFKGGTYAALQNVLDRFSIDLDFDLPDKSKKPTIQKKLHTIFSKLELTTKDQSQKHLQFFLKYPSATNQRNTLKLEINDQPSNKNTYKKAYLPEINMYCNGHTIDTMFANKLVAAKERFDRNNKIAGRDFYDLHQFFDQGLPINQAVIKDRTGKTQPQYLKELSKFIKQQLTQKHLNQDLNPLLTTNKQNKIIPYLKEELLIFIQDEIKRNTKHPIT